MCTEVERVGGGEGGCIQEESENLPDTRAMPEGAEYRREQRLERERGEAGGGDCCLGEGSEGGGGPAWGGKGPKQGGREERQKDCQRFEEKRVVGGDSKVIKMITESERDTEIVHL